MEKEKIRILHVNDNPLDKIILKKAFGISDESTYTIDDCIVETFIQTGDSTLNIDKLKTILKTYKCSPNSPIDIFFSDLQISDVFNEKYSLPQAVREGVFKEYGLDQNTIIIGTSTLEQKDYGLTSDGKSVVDFFIKKPVSQHKDELIKALTEAAKEVAEKRGKSKKKEVEPEEKELTKEEHKKLKEEAEAQEKGRVTPPPAKRQKLTVVSKYNLRDHGEIKKTERYRPHQSGSSRTH